MEYIFTKKKIIPRCNGLRCTQHRSIVSQLCHHRDPFLVATGVIPFFGGFRQANSPKRRNRMARKATVAPVARQKEKRPGARPDRFTFENADRRRSG
jgi:hypothetical protein